MRIALNPTSAPQYTHKFNEQQINVGDEMFVERIEVERKVIEYMCSKYVLGAACTI
jgi:hypothetical protein